MIKYFIFDIFMLAKMITANFCERAFFGALRPAAAALQAEAHPWPADSSLHVFILIHPVERL